MISEKIYWNYHLLNISIEGENNANLAKQKQLQVAGIPFLLILSSLDKQFAVMSHSSQTESFVSIHQVKILTRKAENFSMVC